MPIRSIVPLAALLVALLAPATAFAQSDREPRIRVTEEAELKWSSVGRLLGRLEPGAVLERLGGRDGWTRARMRGWMRSASLSPVSGGFEVEPEEAPVFDRANGDAFGALVRGVDVRRVGGSGEWFEVEMIGWLPDTAVASVAVRPEPAPVEPARPTATADGPTTDGEAALVGRLSRPSGLRAAPEGGALANLPAGTVVRAHETRGGWTRVTVQGWVREGAIVAGEETGVDPEIVAGAAPGAFVGRDAAWTLEHVALQTAEEWRTDLVPGETFDLARVPGSGGLYVYLAIPDRLIPAFQGLEPFETIRVEGRVRTGRSALTGAPILDVSRLQR